MDGRCWSGIHYNKQMKEEDIRFIENPFAKIANIIKPDQDKLFDMLFNLIQQFLDRSEVPTLKSIASIPSETGIDLSAYSGANGYLYTLIRLHRFFTLQKMKTKQTQQKMSSSIKGEDVISSKIKDPDFYLNLAFQQYKLIRQFYDKKKKKPSTLAFYMSETCTWVCGMHLGYLKKDLDFFRFNEKKLIDCYNYYLQERANMHVQLLYGIPGFLYAILQVQDHYDHVEEEIFRTKFGQLSKAITIDVINIGIQGYEKLINKKPDLKNLPPDFRLVYTFHKKEYLGGAHGLGGNLNIILLSMKMNDFSDKLDLLFSLISASIGFLVKHFINKNFTTSAGSTKTKLVHFCHGAPGVVSCLARFQLMFPEKGIQFGIPEIIKASLDHIWNFGVLKKGFGLCHGISGNAYAFILPAVKEFLSEDVEENERKATFFALLREEKGVMKEIKGYHFADRFIKGVSDNPYSLMLGVAGDICFTMDVILGKARFPGFDF